MKGRPGAWRIDGRRNGPHIADSTLPAIEHFPKGVRMTRNIGSTDKVLRLTLAAAFAIAIATGTVSGTLAWILGIGSVVLTATALTSFCGLYSLVGISTCKVKQ